MLRDVSMWVDAQSAVFPGDQPFECGRSLRLEDGASVNLSAIRSSPHVGTHVDAPFHVMPDGLRVGGLDPGAFVGPAVVVDARGVSALDARLLSGVDLVGAPRVLFRTQERTDRTRFLEDFPVLTTDAVAVLARAGVRLVGVDAPSVDPVDSKQLPVHRALSAAGIVNVENLVLDGVAAGRFELLAAPVLWAEAEAAPVRALLRDLPVSAR